MLFIIVRLPKAFYYYRKKGMVKMKDKLRKRFRRGTKRKNNT